MNKYRYNDYYNMTKILDNLYENSRQGQKFNKLMDIITSENNIKLAFRTIKTNTGSKTAGTDGITIQEIKDTEIDKYIELVRNKFNNFTPDSIRRVYIPKPNGDKRPLGIPTIIDRLVQQCIKQVLEPICEAKFHPHSYGFRPNRNTKQAIARLSQLVNIAGFNYVVDIDIKGFFDNVNHNKLIKQIYSLGIVDRKLLSIIKQILKAPIDKEGIPSKGTPQGGILSPLLSNIVLNELDWWISSQWETFKSQREYKSVTSQRNQLKKTRLKQMFIIRYADDFKVVCKSYNDARKIYIAIQEWLNDRLKLQVNKDKSKIVNLRKNYTEFLGFKLKLRKKKNTMHEYSLKSHVSDKSKSRIISNIRKQIDVIRKEPTLKNITRYNSMVLGEYEYYKSATNVNIDFSEIAFLVKEKMYYGFRQIGKFEIPKNKTPLYKRIYSNSRRKTWIIKDLALFPLDYVRHISAMNFDQGICDYTTNGREKSTKRLRSETNKFIIELMKSPAKRENMQYYDNKISRAAMCNMRCEITGLPLNVETMKCIHVKPKKNGGTDEYNNLKIIHVDMLELINAKETKIKKQYIKLINKEKGLKIINKLRLNRNLDKIEFKEIS